MGAPTGPAKHTKRRFLSLERLLPPLLLAPSLIATFLFVYVFIGITFFLSLTNWGTLKINLSLRHPLFATYGEMFRMARFQNDLRNMVIFTLLFLAISLGVGLFLAVLLDHSVPGRSLFRNVFLFPYSLSFIVTGVVWRWLFNPDAGVNLLFNTFGINKLLSSFGVGPLKPGWLTDPKVVLSVNDALGHIFPGVKDLGVTIGIPMALLAVVIAAGWQLSGFAMAMYLAGLATVPEEVREAARVDGATDWQLYRRVILPMLRSTTASIVIILSYVSLKIFDLIYAMSGAGPGFATDVPGIFVFEQTFKATRYNLGAAAAMVMLLPIAVIIFPYLWRSMKREA